MLGLKLPIKVSTVMESPCARRFSDFWLHCDLLKNVVQLALLTFLPLVGDGISVDPPLSRGSAQVYSSSSRRQDCEGERGEISERHRVDVLSAARDET